MSLTAHQQYIQNNFWEKNVFVIMDTETNGLDPAVHGPCEVAMLKIVNGKVQPPKSWYVKPERPIPPHVQAVHHISNEEVKDAPKMEELATVFQEFCKDTIIIAHNAPFDKGMMPCLQDWKFKWADNLRLARHVWPLGTVNPETGQPLTAHKNKILQHWLNLEVDTMGQAAHRAQADILVTAEVFILGVNEYLKTLDYTPNYDHFVKYLESPCPQEFMPFGPHKDQPIDEVPVSHLRHMLADHRSGKRELNIDILTAIQTSYDARTGNSFLAEAKSMGIKDLSLAPSGIREAMEREREAMRLQIQESPSKAFQTTAKPS
jgi:DNA polymerase III epsilon subunit-like protein